MPRIRRARVAAKNKVPSLPRDEKEKPPYVLAEEAAAKTADKQFPDSYHFDEKAAIHTALRGRLCFDACRDEQETRNMEAGYQCLPSEIDSVYHTIYMCSDGQTQVTRWKNGAFSNPLQTKIHKDEKGRDVVILNGPSSNPFSLNQIMNTILVGLEDMPRSVDRLHSCIFRLCRVMREYHRNTMGDIGSAFMVSPYAVACEIAPFIRRILQLTRDLACYHKCTSDMTAVMLKAVADDGVRIDPELMKAPVSSAPIVASFDVTPDSTVASYIRDMILRAAYLYALKGAAPYPLPHLESRHTFKDSQFDEKFVATSKKFHASMRKELVRTCSVMALEQAKIYTLCGMVMQQISDYMAPVPNEALRPNLKNHLSIIQFYASMMNGTAGWLLNAETDLYIPGSLSAFETTVPEERPLGPNPDISVGGVAFPTRGDGKDHDGVWDWESRRMEAQLSSVPDSRDVADALAEVLGPTFPSKPLLLISLEYFRREVPPSIWRPVIRTAFGGTIRLYRSQGETWEELEYDPKKHLPRTVLSIRIRFGYVSLVGEFVDSEDKTGTPVCSIWTNVPGNLMDAEMEEQALRCHVRTRSDDS